MLSVDASNYGLGEVLRQRHDTWAPVAYASRSVTDRTKLRTDRKGDIGNRNWHTTISRLRIWKTLHIGIRSQTPETDLFEANLKCTSINAEIQAQTAKILYDYKIYTWERFSKS